MGIKPGLLFIKQLEVEDISFPDEICCCWDRLTIKLLFRLLFIKCEVDRVVMDEYWDEVEVIMVSMIFKVRRGGKIGWAD